MAFIDQHVGQRHEDADGPGLRWGTESICEQLTGLGARIAPATYCEHRSRTTFQRERRGAELRPRFAAVLVGGDTRGRQLGPHRRPDGGTVLVCPAAGIAFSIDSITPDEAVVRITEASDPFVVFTVRPPAPPPSPPPASTDGPAGGPGTDGGPGPGIGVGASSTRIRGGSAYDRRLDLLIAWDVSGSGPPTSTSLGFIVNGASAGRVNAAAASIRLPVASATWSQTCA